MKTSDFELPTAAEELSRGGGGRGPASGQLFNFVMGKRYREVGFEWVINERKIYRWIHNRVDVRLEKFYVAVSTTVFALHSSIHIQGRTSILN